MAAFLVLFCRTRLPASSPLH